MFDQKIAGCWAKCPNTIHPMVPHVKTKYIKNDISLVLFDFNTLIA